MPEVTINYLAVLVAAVASMIIGAVWYGPLFGKMWMQLVNKKKEDLTKGVAKMYILTFIGALVTAYVLGHISDYAGATNWMIGVQSGFWVWLGFVATAFLSDFLFNTRPWKLYGITVGYHLVSLLAMGAILGAWQ